MLVGNFAFNFSEINAFDPVTGKFLGTLTDAGGNPILNQALWSLHFGNGGIGGDPNTLYFSAGINGEKDGLFGAIQAVPLPHHHDGDDKGDDASTSRSPATPSATMSSSATPSPSNMLVQQIDAIFQEFDVALLALEAKLMALNPQLSSFFLTLNGNLQALEANVIGKL